VARAFPTTGSGSSRGVPGDHKPVAPKALGHLLMGACELRSVVKLQLVRGMGLMVSHSSAGTDAWELLSSA